METKSWPFVQLLLSLLFGILLDLARKGVACKPSRSRQFLPRGDLYCYYRRYGTKSGWRDTKSLLLLFLLFLGFSLTMTTEQYTASNVKIQKKKRMLKAVAVAIIETLQKIKMLKKRLFIGLKRKKEHVCFKT